MKLRKLQANDAPLMLEWMHDDTVVHDLRQNFMGMTAEDCIVFIKNAQDETESIHLAIANDWDEYMGTASLKHIRQNVAELGIVLRACAMGKGYASFGMKGILEYGATNRGIDTVYWCVDPENRRAVRFYEKHGYTNAPVPDMVTGYSDEEKQKYLWYCTKRREIRTE